VVKVTVTCVCQQVESYQIPPLCFFRSGPAKGRWHTPYFAVASQKLDDKTASGDNKTNIAKADSSSEASVANESERKERKKEEK